MPYVPRKKTGKRKYVRKIAKRVPRVSRRSSATFAKKVRNVLMKTCEVKNVNTDPLQYGFNANNGTCSSAVDLCAPLENMSIGATDGARLGNRIRLKRYDLRMCFTMNPDYVNGNTFRPGYVQVWLATLKTDKSAMPNAVDLTRIYEDGGASSGPNHLVINSLRDLNRNYYNFHAYKKFKLGGATNAYPNNDFPIQKFLTFKNILKGEVVWNDTTLSCNKALYLFCHFVTVDSIQLSISVPIICDFYISCKYIDI